MHPADRALLAFAAAVLLVSLAMAIVSFVRQ